MTDEEVLAYVSNIENSSLEDIEKVLPNRKIVNFDEAMNRINNILYENINLLKELNDENDYHLLDEEIDLLLKKYDFCIKYLKGDELSKKNEDVHRIVFAKTPTGKAYFRVDLDKVPRENYDDVKKALNYIVNGVSQGDQTKFKFYTNSNLGIKVFEYKVFQVRVFATKLKGNVLCVFGLSIKKANEDKKLASNLRFRVSKIKEQVDMLKGLMDISDKKTRLLEDSQGILDEIMAILNREEPNIDGESDVTYSNNELPIISESMANQTSVHSNFENNVISGKNVPMRSFKLKRENYHTAIVKSNLIDDLEDLGLDELFKVQRFISDLKMDKKIGDMYESFVKMSASQRKEFVSDLELDKNRKHK